MGPLPTWHLCDPVPMLGLAGACMLAAKPSLSLFLRVSVPCAPGLPTFRGLAGRGSLARRALGDAQGAHWALVPHSPGARPAPPRALGQEHRDLLLCQGPRWGRVGRTWDQALSSWKLHPAHWIQALHSDVLPAASSQQKDLTGCVPAAGTALPYCPAHVCTH